MDSPTQLIETILDLDSSVQRQLRLIMPESWLNSAMPLSATRALFAIERGHANTPRGVAEALGVSRTSVTGMLDRLEADHLITRTLDSADRRSFLLEVTDAGRQLVRDLAILRREQLALALRSMDVSSLESLKLGLEALMQAMQQQARQTVIEQP